MNAGYAAEYLSSFLSQQFVESHTLGTRFSYPISFTLTESSSLDASISFNSLVSFFQIDLDVRCRHCLSLVTMRVALWLLLLLLLLLLGGGGGDF